MDYIWGANNPFWNVTAWFMGSRLDWLMRWTWWHDDMETLSASLALCNGNTPSTVDSPHKWPVMLSFNTFFLNLNKLLNKLSKRRWIDTPWRKRDVSVLNRRYFHLAVFHICVKGKCAYRLHYHCNKTRYVSHENVPFVSVILSSTEGIPIPLGDVTFVPLVVQIKWKWCH